MHPGAQALQAAEGLQVAMWQLSKIEAGHKKAALDAERASALYNEKALTKTDYDAAEAQLNATRAQVEAARKNIEAQKELTRSAAAGERLSTITFNDTALTAPTSGVVLDKRIEPGSLVGRGTPVIRLGDIGTVRFAFSVPDTVVTALRLGAPLEVCVNAVPDRAFHGRIREIAAAGDPSTRLYRIEVAIPNPKMQLKTGMMGNVSVSTSTRAEALPAVPANALLRSPSDPNAASVFVVDRAPASTHAQLRTIRLGSCPTSDDSARRFFGYARHGAHRLEGG